MANPTQLPAFRAEMGDWTYYSCLMSYAQVARQVNFAFELGGNKDLSTMIQRGITSRTEEITEYLLTNEHHFLGSLIIAAWGGSPDFVELEMADPSNMLPSLDEGFGVLVFDGTQSYFALDGQHRLRAIKDAVKTNPKLGSDQISVLIVPHLDTKEGNERTRRLFTNINRTARSTTHAENIALDEDDAFAIVTRQLLTDHELLSRAGLVRVFTKAPGATGSGEIVLAKSNVTKTDPRAWTSIGTLYNICIALGFQLDPSVYETTIRPNDEALSGSFQILSVRIDEILSACGDLRKKLVETKNARDLRAPVDAEGLGHPFMRPAIQRAVSETVRYLIDQQKLDWPTALTRLADLEWKLEAAPWDSVFAGRKMLTGKEHTELLRSLLVAHLAPSSKKSIADVRRQYKEMLGRSYSVSAEKLESNLPTDE